MNDQDPEWAICCSGGGIRSATYCLGALQSLQQRGLNAKARWIVGVSGGSYIAASLALVRHGLKADAELPAYAPGSAEEQHLRNNTRYIAPDAKTVLVGLLSLLLGVVVTFALVMAPVYALSHAWGWLLRSQGVLTWTRSGASASVTAWSWWLAPAVAAGVTLILFAFWWVTLPAEDADRGAQRARWTGWAAFITAVLALAMLAAPPVISWLYHSTGAVGTIAHAIGFGGAGHWTAGTLSGLLAALVAVAGWCRTRLAKVKVAENQATSGSPGLVTQVTRYAISHLTPWLASAVVVAVGVIAALTWTGSAAHTGYTLGQLLPVGVAVAIVLGTRAVADFNRLSLHDGYRWRLATAYAVTRAACQATGRERAKLFAAAARTRLSELSQDDGPMPVICTTANINAKRDVRPGQGGFCLAFDPKQTRLRGRPGSVEDCVAAATADYEHLVGHSRLTLFDLVAISGAAVSPLMGSATKVAYRILLTATNVRLGVWLPHPTVVSNARAYLNKQYDHDPATDEDPGSDKDPWWSTWTPLLVVWYVLPHPGWHAKPRRSERWEARLWSRLLEVREGASGRWAKFGAAVCWRIMQPTMGMLWAEAAGHTSYRATWINVTDGGHYDNLGLVEALRRQPTHVLALDASGDHANTWSTIGGSIALARMDAGMEIDLDPSTMITDLKDKKAGEVDKPWASGYFRCRGAAEPSQRNLVVCKLGWWQKAPWDVVAYAHNNPSYPCEPTLQQLYDSREFEAYRALGASSAALDFQLAPPAPPQPPAAASAPLPKPSAPEQSALQESAPEQPVLAGAASVSDHGHG
ncbi:MAG TPA: hypothetical protein VH089_13775 [Streptosporangiaceae bacterium]|nr:hypothetical protein [Streptosporangiaceae bacterium]